MVRFNRVGLRYATQGGREPDGEAAGAPEVLRDISFTLPDGAFRWLLGPSGAGKSSLLRLMHLALRPTRGEVEVLGLRVGAARRAALPRLRRRIGVVHQDFRLLPHLSAFDNVALPLRIAGRQERQVRADLAEFEFLIPAKERPVIETKHQSTDQAAQQQGIVNGIRLTHPQCYQPGGQEQNPHHKPSLAQPQHKLTCFSKAGKNSYQGS